MTSSYKKSRVRGGAYYIRSLGSRSVQDKAGDESWAEQTGQPPGQWYVGPLANGVRHSALSLVDGQDFGAAGIHDDLRKFARLVHGLHPFGVQKLVKNVGEKNRVSFHDFTLSAPKSVSVLWSQADASTRSSIMAAHYVGARVFLDFMSRKSYTRSGKGGVVKILAPLRAILFAHCLSREDDPQLHIHCIVFNICEFPDGHTGALETLEMMCWTGAASSFYHAAFAFEIRKLGFDIEKKDNLFEVRGVPQAVCLEFSRRRQKILTAVRHKLQYGKDREGKVGNTDIAQASRALFQVAALETRNRKSESAHNLLDLAWRARGAALGFTRAHVEALIQLERPDDIGGEEELLQMAQQAVQGITEKSSVFSEPALLIAIAVALTGRASSAQILHSVELLKATELISTLPTQVYHQQFSKPITIDGVEKERVFTTRQMLVLERQILELAARKTFCDWFDATELPASLHAGQRSAALHALTDDHAVSVIISTSDTARALVIAAISRTYERFGYAVIVLVNTRCSVETLKKAAGSDDVQAITGWIKDVNEGVLAVDNKFALVLDGADMVGTREMAAFLKIAAGASAKVVLVGGALNQQAISIGTGSPLRIIAKQNGAFQLDCSQDQSSESERYAVHCFFAGQASEGLKAYVQQLHFHVDGDAVHEAIIRGWRRSRLMHPGQSHLILALDRKSVRQLNVLAHAARQAAGELSGGLMLQTLDCRQGELAEVSINDLVVFSARDMPASIARRGEGTVVQIHGAVIQVQTGDDLVVIDTSDAKWRHKSGGLALTHGYAATVLSSRTLTVDRVWLKDALALCRITSGIAMSRHRESCEVHVNMTARYEANMRESPADQWHPLEEFGTDQCLRQLGQAWSAEREKNATVDFAQWEIGRARVDVSLEVRIQRIIDQNDQRSQDKAVKSPDVRLLRRNRKRQESMERPIDSRRSVPFGQPQTHLLKTLLSRQIVIIPTIDTAIDAPFAEDIDAKAASAQGTMMVLGRCGQSALGQPLPASLESSSGDPSPMNRNAEQEQSEVLEDAEPEAGVSQDSPG